MPRRSQRNHKKSTALPDTIFADLPLDVAHIILALLDKEGRKSLRLVSKAISKVCLDAYYSKLQFFNEPLKTRMETLDILEEIHVLFKAETEKHLERLKQLGRNIANETLRQSDSLSKTISKLSTAEFNPVHLFGHKQARKLEGRHVPFARLNSSEPWHVTYLDFGDHKMDRCLTTGIDMDYLEELSVCDKCLLAQNAGPDIFARMKRLKKLVIYNTNSKKPTKQDDSFLLPAFSFQHNSAIDFMRLTYCKLAADFWFPVSLTQLILIECLFDADSMDMLMSLPNLRRLECELEIRCEIDNFCIEELTIDDTSKDSDFTVFKALKVLEFAGFVITEQELVTFLTKLDKHPTLSEVHLSFGHDDFLETVLELRLSFACTYTNFTSAEMGDDYDSDILESDDMELGFHDVYAAW